MTIAIRATDLVKSYSPGLYALDGVSLEVTAGEVWGVIGPSGSGKTTLLMALAGFVRPDGGSILFGDREMIATPPNKRGLGMVFQSFNLWSHMTILENIIEAPIHVLGKNKKDAENEALVLMEQVGIQDKANSYPIHLSGGQQQRVAIARALAISPEILLFDEPTSSLDPELVDEVLSVMRKLAEEGKTMLVVTHEMEFARKVSNNVIFLHNGLVEEQGHPDTVFTNPQSERCRNFLFNRRE